MPAPSAAEREFLNRLQRAEGLSERGAGLFDRLDGKMRCLVPAQSFLASPPPPAPRRWLLPNLFWRLLWHGWRYLREVSGDDAYERYLQHLARFHPGEKPMTRAEHFKLTQEQKWNRLSRCC